MCTVAIAVGAAIGAATSAATGNDPLMGAVLGGVGGYFAPVSFGVTPLAPAYQTASSFGFSLGSSFVSYAGAATAAGIGLAGGYLMNAMTPQTPDYSQFGYGAQPYEPQGYSYQHATVTGSGGRQAAAVLAQEIKRTRTARQRQQEETTAYSVAGELASTGLQIA